MAKSIRKNTVFSVLKTCSSMLYALVTLPYVTRVLQPENLGKVTFSQSFVNYFSMLAMLGIATYAVRECATVRLDKDALGRVASQIVSINLVSAVSAYLLLYTVIAVFRNRFIQYYGLIIIESATILLQVVGADWLNSAMEDFRYIAIRTVAIQVIALIAVFSLVHKPEDYYRYLIISLLSTSGPFLINIPYRNHYCKIRFTLRMEWKRHLPPIFFLFVMTLSQTVMNNTDIIMLGLIKGDYEVGLYSTAHKATRIIGYLVQAVALVIIPRLTILFNNNDFDNANRLLRKVLMFNLGLGLPCIFGALMLAEEIIFLLGGAEYSGAVPVIRLLILSIASSLVGGSFLGNAILIPMKKEKYYMMVCIIAALLNVLLNAILIPVLGAIGASISTVINGFVILVLLLLKIDNRIHVDRLSSLFFGPILGCIIIVLVCWGLSGIHDLIWRTIASICLSVAGYSAALILCKSDFAVEILSTIMKRFRKE